MTEQREFDAIVIGAGAGGLFTAARLAHRGYRTLVVERLDKVGGRASTDDVDGFKVNNGAIVIEVGGITQQTCEEVGAPFEIREPSPPILYRIGGKDVDVVFEHVGQATFFTSVFVCKTFGTNAASSSSE